MAAVETTNAVAKPWRWPDTKPDVAPDPTSLLAATTAIILQSALSSSTRCVVELGSFLGASTRLILTHAPNAIVYAIDHWRGPASMHRPHMAAHRHRIPTLFEAFTVNCWPWRERLRPVRLDTVAGVEAVAEYIRATGEPSPDVVFIDADHEPISVWKDMAAAAKAWPAATLVGDDYESTANHGGLAKAVHRFARKRKRKVTTFGNGWRMEP